MQYNIKDNSGDKKYFTQIPNMIVNHSTAYEQSLYLIMKRLAGENGQCWASLNFLAKKMGADKKTVTQTINKLLERKWIKEIEKTKVRGGAVRTFVIIDLWATNITEYEVDAKSPLKESGRNFPESGRNFPESGRQRDTKKIYNKIDNKSAYNLSYKGMPVRKHFDHYQVLCKGGWIDFTGSLKDLKVC